MNHTEIGWSEGEFDGVFSWLMDGDPALRWQVMRDLLACSPDQVATERARVATDGWGARLLAMQDPESRTLHRRTSTS